MPATSVENVPLEERVREIARELKFFPDEEVLVQVPSWHKLLQEIREKHGSLAKLRQSLDLSERTVSVEFPAPYQLHTMAAILEKKRVIIGDEPGTQKTAPAALAKYAVEQLQLGGKQKLKTLIICPGYIISNWVKQIEAYTTNSPKVVVINSDNKNFVIEQAAKPDTDYILISYDMIFRSLGINKSDPAVMEELEARATELVNSNTKEQLLLKLAELDSRYARKYAEKKAEDVAPKVAELEMRKEQEAAKIVEKLGKIFSGEEQYYVIMDEFHNAKNPKSLRSKAIRQIALNADYLALLSGTKTPDNLNDIANIASILDSDTFPTADSFIERYNGNPDLIRLFYQQWEKKPVLRPEHLGTIPELLEPKVIRFNLSKNERTIYEKILADETIFPNEKLLLLRLATMNAALLDHKNYPGSSEKIKEKLQKSLDSLESVFGSLESTRYKALESLVDDIVKRGEKVIVYTKYTAGITDALTKMFAEKGYGVCTVNDNLSADSKEIALSDVEIRVLRKEKQFAGQKYRSDLTKSQRQILKLQEKPMAKFSDRDIQILEFQTNPQKQIMITTMGTLREGRDLYSANNVVFLDREYSPGIEWQCIKRAHRSGQTKPVQVYYFEASSTVDQGIAVHILKKRMDIERAEAGVQLTDEEKARFKQRAPPEKDPDIARYLISPQQIVSLMSGSLVAKGSERLKKFLQESDNAKLYADCYNTDWEYTYSAQTARLLEQVVDSVEARENRKLEDIIDLGCGPAVASRQLKRKAICVDLNEFQLANGQKECEELGILDNKYITASITNLPFIKNESSDLTICSLALHYGDVEEREQIVKEANRITKTNGYFLIALPKSIVNDNGKEKLESGLESLGFKLEKELSGIYVAVEALNKDGEPKASSYEVYFAVAQKLYSSADKTAEKDAFVLDSDFFVSKPKAEKEKQPACTYIGEGEICTKFYNTSAGKTLEHKLKVKAKEEPIKEIKEEKPPSAPATADETFDQYDSDVLDLLEDMYDDQ